MESLVHPSADSPPAVADRPGSPPPRPAPAKRARCNVRHADALPTIVSDLTSFEPVSEAEINLVLAVLGDTIASILNAEPMPCQTCAPTDDA